MSWLRSRAAALQALVAADRGAVDDALLLAGRAVELGASRHCARWVVVAGLASGHVLQRAPEFSGDQMSAGLEHIDAALRVIDHVDRDFAKPMLPQLLASRIAIHAVVGEHAAMTADLAALERAWDALVSDPVLVQAMGMVKVSMTVSLGALAAAGWALLSQLRVAEARRLLGLTARLAGQLQDAKVDYISSNLLANAAMLAGEETEAAGWAERATRRRARRRQFVTPVPESSDALLEAMLARTEAWLAERRGDRAGAAAALRRARQRTALIEGDEAAHGRMLALANELDFVQRTEGTEAATSLAYATDVFSALTGVAGGVLSGPVVRLTASEEPPTAAAMVIARLSRDYQWRVPFSLVIEHLGLMTSVCVRAGEDELALDCAERAADAISLLGSGTWLPSARRDALRVRRELRDECLLALARMPGSCAAATSALLLMEAWREGTLRDLMTSQGSALPDAVLSVVADLRSVLGAALADPSPWDTEVLRERVAGLREELASAVGAAYASMVAPATLSAPDLQPLPQEVLVSACVVADGVGEWIVTVVHTPSGDTHLRRSRLTAEVRTFLSTVGAGFDPVVMSQIRRFQEHWQRARESLSWALGVDVLEDSGTAVLPVRFVLDDELRVVPLPALGTGEDLLGETRPVSHSAYVAVGQRDPARPRRQRVLVFAFTEATPELDALEELSRAGRIDVTVAATLRHLCDELNAQDFDVLVIAAHGDGSGLAYHFTDSHPDAEPMYVHDLLGSRVPPVVIAAACYSGSGGETDITGLLATLHANGAREIVSSLWAIPTVESSEMLHHIILKLPTTAPLAEIVASEQRRFRRAHPTRDGLYWWAGLAVSGTAT